MIKDNIGTLGVMLRITSGFTLLTFVIPKLVRRPKRRAYQWLGLLASFTIAEGIVRYCPVVALFEYVRARRRD